MPPKKNPSIDSGGTKKHIDSGGTKKHIQEVALSLFEELGFDETSIPMICEKAGIAKTTFHYYFPRKQDLFEDMYNFFEERYNNSFHRILEQDSYTQQIWEIFRIMFEGDTYYGVTTTQHYFLQRLKEHDQRRFIDSIYHKKMLVATIRSAQKAGQILNRSSAEKLAEALSYAGRGVILTWAIENGTMNLIDCGKEVIRSIICPAEGFDI